MKFLTYEKDGKLYPGIADRTGEGIIPLYPEYVDINEFIEKSDESVFDALKKRFSSEDGSERFEDVTLRSPIVFPRQDVICLGINYAEHAKESGGYDREAFGGEKSYPIYFSKRVNEAVGDGEYVDSHKGFVERLDYEAEFAVVLGKPAFDVSEDDALDYVFGYTVLNDISARDIQTRHKQWYFGKSLDRFTPIGPWIVTPDEAGDIENLYVRSYVNDELRQDGNTADLIFNVRYIISELSRGMTLLPGTIIATGTPAGVGMGYKPPRFMEPGDEVVCEIENIGRLRNIIR